ncbi:MAG: GNAT family N-acetyltransferase [Moraxellaceae bacterium]
MMQVNVNSPVIRLMQATDLNQVMAIQLTCYSAAYHEALSVLQQRFNCSPQTAWVAVDEHGVGGYLVAYVSSFGKVTALHSSFACTGQPDTLYIHDLAIDPRLGGQGVAARLIQTAFETAQTKHLRGLALVAVQDSTRFWRRHGFAPLALATPQQQANLAVYGAAAVYLYADVIEAL